MLNLLQKLHALYVTDELNVWHFAAARPPIKPFVYWLASEPDNKDGHGFDTLEEMIEAAYAHIDPLAKPLPDEVPVPPQVASVESC